MSFDALTFKERKALEALVLHKTLEYTSNTDTPFGVAYDDVRGLGRRGFATAEVIKGKVLVKVKPRGERHLELLRRADKLVAENTDRNNAIERQRRAEIQERLLRELRGMAGRLALLRRWRTRKAEDLEPISDDVTLATFHVERGEYRKAQPLIDCARGRLVKAEEEAHRHRFNGRIVIATKKGLRHLP